MWFTTRSRKYLFTFSPFKLWDPDLQTGATNYPNNRIINIGLTIGF